MFRLALAGLGVALGLEAVVAVPLDGQTRPDLRVQSVVTLADQQYVGGGLGLTLGAGSRGRLGALAMLGERDGALAARFEATLTLHLEPFARRGVGIYGGGGAAFVTGGGPDAEYLVLFLGVETAPARRAGVFVEGGVGGGVRLAAGYRLRLHAAAN